MSIEQRVRLSRALSCVALLILSGLLAACGGGGGSGGASGSGSGAGSPSGSFTVSPTTLSVSALTTDPAPTATTTITLSLSASATVYAVGSSSHVGIDSVSAQGSGTTATLTVQFKAPGSLGPGSYTDTISLRMCFDSACQQPLSGGPATVTTHYTVTASPQISLANAQVSVSASITDTKAPVYTVPLVVSYPPAGGLYFNVSNTSTGIQSVSVPSGPVTAPQIVINFMPPANVGPGTYSDSVTIQACLDVQCLPQVSGSPVSLMVTYTVSMPTLATTGQLVLAHDVIDARYSRALDAIVTVSAHPTNALYLYDVKTKTEVSQALNKPPTALTLGPSGLDAAVGHDALISYLSLSALTQPNPPAPTQLNVSIPVFDLVLDGNGYVHAVAATGQWTSLHSVRIATNVETVSQSALLYSGSHAKLQPNTSYIYTADNGLSPSSATKWDVTNGTGTYLYELFNASPCGNLWFGDDGVTAYSQCGRVLKASSTQAQDLAYAGQLTLINHIYSLLLTWADESDAAKEILGVQTDTLNCGPNGVAASCSTYVAAYDSAYLGVNGLYSLPPMTVGGIAYQQRAQFVFHSADGTQRFLISMLYGAPDPTAQYYLATF